MESNILTDSCCTVKEGEKERRKRRRGRNECKEVYKEDEGEVMTGRREGR